MNQIRIDRTKLLVCLAMLLPVAFAQAPKSVTVNATGTVYGEPDEASFDAGVSALNADVQVATTAVSRRVSSLLEALRAAGIADKDIRTSNFTIYPEQNYDNNGQPTSLRYRVTNTVHVTLRDMAQLGALLGRSVEAGANEISNVVYTFSSQDALERQAREQAMNAARTKAEQLARFGGAELGAVRRITEGPQAGGGGPLPSFRMDSVAAEAGAAVPVSSGQLAVTVSVQVVFGLK